MSTGNTYVVEKVCPICGEKTRVIKVRSRLIAEKSDPDFCTYYQDFNPYYYTVWVCEHCGFAADEKTFTGVIPALHKSKIKDFLANRKVGFKFDETRGLPEAVASYKLAIFYSELIDESLAHIAGLYLKLAWLYRTSGKAEEGIDYLRKAGELYDRSVMTERYPIGQMSDYMAIYLTGAIYYISGDIEQATQYLSRLMSDQTLRETEPKLFERARNLWQDIREAKKTGEDE